MAYNYIPKYIRQSENKSPKGVVTASRWNELFNLLIQQGDHTAEELGKILNYLSAGLEDLASNIAGNITEEHEYASAFEIHLHTNTNPITADKTFAEIRQAIVDGREITLWVSNVQCLKPACKVYEGSIILAVFGHDVPGQALDVDLYRCSDEDDWYVATQIKLANQAYVDGLANEKLDKTGGVISGDLGVTGKLNIGATVSITETNNNLLQLAGDYGAPVTISNVDTPVADNDVATKKYVDEHAGGGGESVLYVNVTQSGSAITGDKTYAEILAAVTANKCVIVKFADTNFYLDSVANDKIAFQRLNISEDDESRKSIDKQLVCVSNSDAWTVDADFVAVDTAMSDTSEMPVQNKVVKAYIDGIKTEVPTKTSQLTNDSGFLTSHQDISGKQDKATLEADVAAKGFTKNTGTYSKPTGGIPKADLAASVQTSLGKADTALQEHQSLAAYRTAVEQNRIDSGKVNKVIGKGLSTNDYTAADKAKVDAIPANPKYTDTVYDDTALKERVATIEGKESAWDAKSDFSGSYNDLTDKPAPLIGTTGTLTPTQVYNAVSAGIPVKVQYTDSTYGLLSFTAFNIAESLYTIVSQTIVYYDDYYILAELSGNLNGGWTFKSTMLAELTGLDNLDVRVNKLEGAGYLTLATLPKYGGEVV